MIKLLAKLAVISGLVALSVGIMWHFAPHFAPKDKQLYYGSMDDKVKRLAELPSPKIILVGGSNVTYGVDSMVLEKKLRLPVVNMSLLSALGLEFMLNQLRNHVHRNDIVVIAPEYGLFVNANKSETGVLMYDFLIDNPSYVLDMPPQRLLYHVDALGTTLAKYYTRLLSFRRAEPAPDEVAFNVSGDMTGHLNSPNKEVTHDVLIDPCEIDEHVIEQLNSFSNDMKKSGAVVMLSYPAVSRTHYAKNRACFDAIANEIDAKAVPLVISKRSNYVFDDSMFFNTCNHLNRGGRELRSDNLVRDIGSALPGIPYRQPGS